MAVVLELFYFLVSYKIFFSKSKVRNCQKAKRNNWIT